MSRWETVAAVQGLIHRCVHLGDRGDAAAVAALFHADGVLETAHGVRAVGREAVRDYFELLADPGGDGVRPAFVRHHVSSIDVVEYDDTFAEVRSYFLVVTDQGVDHTGRYRDRVTPDADGTWRFARRYVRLDAPPRSRIFTTGFVGG